MPNELTPLDDLDVITIIDEVTGLPVELRPLSDDETGLDIRGRNKGTPRLAITQSGEDERAPGLPPGTFFLTHSIFALDEENGTGKKEKQIIVIEEMPEVHLLGMREVRSYFAQKYRAGVEAKPCCGSVDGKRPNPEFVAAGTAPAPFCIGKDPAGRTLPYCPMAKWETNGTGENAERNPPKCVYAIQAGFAVEMADGEWLVFDAFFKRTSELAGKQLFQAAITLKNQGIASYLYPVRIKGAIPKSKVGRIFIAVMSEQQADLDSSTIAKLEELKILWLNTQMDYVARVKAQALPAPAGVPQLPAGTRNATPDETNKELDRVFAPSKPAAGDEPLF